MRKILKISGITLGSLLLIAFLIPVIFKKQIKALVKKEINKSLHAKVDFADASLSLFRHFPRVTIVVEDLTVVGLGDFAGDTLAAVKNFNASAELFSVLRGKNIKVSGIYLNEPRIRALVNKQGKASWEIFKRSADTTTNTDTSASSFKMQLKKYEINNGYLLYRDEQANTYMELTDFDHKGTGNLSADVFTLLTSTKATSASFSQDGIPYLAGAKTDIDAAIKIDNHLNTYTFDTKDVLLNNLKLSVQGFVKMIDASTFDMDIKFNSPTNEFKDILSMIPAIYKKDFDEIKTSGKGTFNGFIKGISSPEKIPAYNVKLDVKDGSFQYPDLPKPVKNIQLSLTAGNPDGQPDNAVIEIPKGHIEMDNEPFDFRFIYSKPMSTQLIDAAAKGKIDLSQVSKFIKLQNGTKMSGLVWADAFVKGPMKALQAQSGNFTAGGFFDIKNLFYADNHFPQPIKNGNLKATLENSGGIADNTTINIATGHVEVGNDPIDFSLQLRNPVSAVDFSGKAKGRFTLDNIKQFTTLEAGTTISGILNTDLGFAGNKAVIVQERYDKLVLDGAAAFSHFTYQSKAYPSGVSIANTQLKFTQKNVTLDGLNGHYLNTHFTATGIMNNLVGFIMQGEGLSGNLAVHADKMNLNDWMGTQATTPITESNTSKTASTGSSTPFLVPPGVNFTIDAAVDNVTYDKVDYNAVKGKMLIGDEKVTLQNVSTNVLDGTALINGSYSTKINKKEPDISFSYDIRDMDVQKAFLSYNTIQFLMPIGKFLSGKLNSALSLTGNLNGSMMPKLNSLNGKANLLLLQGVLKQFAPLEKLAGMLQIDRLKSISMKDIKQYVEFANGKVFVRPFTIKIDDIEMQVSGFHGFDQSIDYAIKMKLPRSVMGNKGNDLVNGLAAKATNAGLPFKLGETINLDIKMMGSISNPSIGINLKGMVDDVVKDMEQQAKDFIQAKLDSAKQKAKDSLAAVKEQVEQKLKDKLKEKILGKDTTVQNNNPADTTKKVPTKEKITNKLKDIFLKPKKPVVKDSMSP